MSLIVRNISVAYGKREVVKDLSFHAEAGQLSCIVGPNGSGKSTLIKAVCGDVPYAGDIAVNGFNLRDLRPWEVAAMRAVLPQATSLAFPFTAIEVVRMGLQTGQHGIRSDLPLMALRRVGLDRMAGAFFQELSGGQQQRVQLARVLAQVWDPVSEAGPRWLILDEPVSSLDIAHQMQVMQIARDYADQGGGVIAVMHDLNLTAAFADHIMVMKDGQLLGCGTPAQTMQNCLLSDAYDYPIEVSFAPDTKAVTVLPAGLNCR